METNKIIRKHIMESFLFTDDESALQDNASLIAQGLIDSIGIMELVEFVEGSFSIKVDPKEIVPDNLDSVEKMVAFVERKKAA
ncbi:MAG: acyl carrier protein [Methylococcaceae bacterium]|nr:acyl carrier protein [Methylococcaceae bacterium]